MTLEHRLIAALTLICAALLGITIASAEILGEIDWAAADGACIAGDPLPAGARIDTLSFLFRA